jgi:hypothetical protein
MSQFVAISQQIKPSHFLKEQTNFDFASSIWRVSTNPRRSATGRLGWGNKPAVIADQSRRGGCAARVRRGRRHQGGLTGGSLNNRAPGGGRTLVLRAEVRKWVDTTCHPKTNKQFTAMVFQPMRELLTDLRANAFRIFIVSGGGVEFMTAFAEITYGVPAEQMIARPGLEPNVRYLGPWQAPEWWSSLNVV